MRAVAIAITTTALAALAFVPAAGAVKSGGKSVRVAVNCIGSLDGIYVYGRPVTGAGCQGTLTLRLRERAVGSSAFALSNNQTTALSVKLSARARTALRRAGSIRIKVGLVARGSVFVPKLLTVELKKRKKR